MHQEFIPEYSVKEEVIKPPDMLNQFWQSVHALE